MKRKSKTLATTIAAMGLMLGCSNDEESTAPAGPRLTQASTVTQALLAETEPYKSWSRVGDGSRIQSEGHSNMFVTTFYNDIIREAAQARVMPLPDGAIFVKEGYPSMDAASPMAITFMSKMDGEWYWVQASPDDQVFVDEMGLPLEGKNVGMCMGCHDSVADNDFVFSELAN